MLPILRATRGFRNWATASAWRISTQGVGRMPGRLQTRNITNLPSPVARIARNTRVRPVTQASRSTILGRLRGARYNSTDGPVRQKIQKHAPNGIKAKLKELSQKYGWAAVGVYLGLSALDFPFCFLAVRMLGAERVGQAEHFVVDRFWRLIGLVTPSGSAQKDEELTAPSGDVAVKDGTDVVAEAKHGEGAKSNKPVASQMSSRNARATVDDIGDDELLRFANGLPIQPNEACHRIRHTYRCRHYGYTVTSHGVGCNLTSLECWGLVRTTDRHYDYCCHTACCTRNINARYSNQRARIDAVMRTHGRKSTVTRMEWQRLGEIAETHSECS
nr:uncharacterized protein CFP56_16546 [Quercus suber]